VMVEGFEMLKFLAGTEGEEYDPSTREPEATANKSERAHPVGLV